MKWFNKQSRLIQLILLLVPVVNWVTELVVRWTTFLEKKDIIHLLIAIVVTFGGLIVGYVDLVWVILFNHLILGK